MHTKRYLRTCPDCLATHQVTESVPDIHDFYKPVMDDFRLWLSENYDADDQDCFEINEFLKQRGVK